jgi:hypothetical protein
LNSFHTYEGNGKENDAHFDVSIMISGFRVGACWNIPAMMETRVRDYNVILEIVGAE